VIDDDTKYLHAVIANLMHSEIDKPVHSFYIICPAFFWPASRSATTRIDVAVVTMWISVERFSLFSSDKCDNMTEVLLFTALNIEYVTEIVTEYFCCSTKI